MDQYVGERITSTEGLMFYMKVTAVVYQLRQRIWPKLILHLSLWLGGKECVKKKKNHAHTSKEFIHGMLQVKYIFTHIMIPFTIFASCFVGFNVIVVDTDITITCISAPLYFVQRVRCSEP